jgi:FkbM family methyltransferase
MQTKITTDSIYDIDTLIHLGAGSCSEFTAYLNTPIANIILVEGDPHLIKVLHKKYSETDKVNIINAVVSDHKGQAIFNRYNFSDLNSIHTPNDFLLELYPGLVKIEEIHVETVTPTSLLESLVLDAEKNNKLIIDAPGEELALLKDILNGQKLHFFKFVQLYCGIKSLYINCNSSIQILNWLQTNGYDLVSQDHSLDPDRPCFNLQRNIFYVHNLELKSQIKQILISKNELARTAVEQKRLAEQRSTEIESLTNDLIKLEMLAKDRQLQLEQTITIKDEYTKQTLEQKEIIQQLTTERDDLAKLTRDRLSQLEEAIKTKDEQTKQKEVAVQQLTAERDDLAKLARDRLSQLEETIKSKDEQTKQKEVAVQQLTAERDDLAKLARDRLSQLEQAIKTKDEQTKLRIQQKDVVQQLTTERDDLAKLARDRLSQLEEAIKSKDEQTKQKEVAVQQLTAERDDLAKLARDRLSQLEEAIKTKDEQTKLRIQQKDVVQQLTTEREDLAKLARDRLSQLEQTNKFKDEQIKLVNNLKSRNQQLENKLSELVEIDLRQSLLIEEMNRAEGQIELIKDILIRESGI